MKQPLKITPEMTIIWKLDTVDYLKSLYANIPEVLQLQLMGPKALKCSFKRKGTFLLQPEDMVHEAFFLRKGLVKLYSIDKKSGQQKIFFIWWERMIVVMYKEFRENLPIGDYYLELMEDCELVSITNFCMEGIYTQHNAAHELTNKILTEKKRLMLMHMDILLTPVKIDRYGMLEGYFPKLRGRLSGEDTCAFIGVSPATLSNSKNED